MAGKEERRIIKIGNSKGLTIPKAFINYHKLKVGNMVKVFYRDTMIVVPKKTRVNESKVKKALEVLEK